MKLDIFVAAVICSCAVAEYVNEFVELPGHKVKNDYTLPMPGSYVPESALPDSWDWSDVNGTSFVTKSLNQHIPQYCGSCWAHGALSALADRIKIARSGRGVDLNLAVQYILNCGGDVAGSCHGGSHLATYEFIKQQGYVPYDTCLTYEACSSESDEGLCQHGDYTCKDSNICRTCSTFSTHGGFCGAITAFPNASIAEYGQVPDSVSSIKSELYMRGPIACGVNAEPLLKYVGGVFNDKSADQGINHVVSMTGWGVDEDGTEYWIIRNSWGEYWGELGYFRIATGDNQLGIEAQCVWATPSTWTETNFPCYEDGTNCGSQSRVGSGQYVDPAIRFGIVNGQNPSPNSLSPQ